MTAKKGHAFQKICFPYLPYENKSFILLYLGGYLLVLYYHLGFSAASWNGFDYGIQPHTLPDNQSPKQGLPNKQIAIIGGTGNVGSFLSMHFISAGYEVTAFDKNPSVPAIEAVELHSNSLTTEDIKRFDAIIFLGGCTGRHACARLSPEERREENTEAIVRLAKKMKYTQHLVTASTSAVSEGRRGARENDTVMVDLLDEYSLSMYHRELKLKRFSDNWGHTGPRISILRFGTVVGLSPAQRTDLLFPSLLKSAYTTGILRVQNYDGMRSFLALDDLARSVEILLLQNPDCADGDKRFHVWNLASFHASILKVATTISSKTGATLDVLNMSGLRNSSDTVSGFTITPEAFSKAFNFTFKGSLEHIVHALDHNVPESITPKGPHLQVNEKWKDSIPCPVCGSKDQQLVLDLGMQPFANDFQKEVSMSLVSPRFPLRLVRCRACNHYHLSHVASREDLFQHYLYQSGTSATLKKHFEWLAGKVVEESEKKTGNVLELACNDGSQLNQFKALGWNTYGVDPAENLAKLARKQNHTIQIGFWPLSFPGLPTGDDLTAIVAQNVFAHVPDPVSFLRACAEKMGPKTKLYIQTSQCNMQQLGQFDTMYHEHISFFTGHSFQKAAQLANLQIDSFETTPIHGTSCLVTMKLKEDKLPIFSSKKQELAPTMEHRLNQERHDGVTDDFFGERFMSRATKIREWMLSEVTLMKQDGYQVGAYGAAAKGMTLLHFMLDGQQHDDSNRETLVEWVLDDGYLKQNTFCPGTSIPVLSTESIKGFSSDKPLAVVVLAWNFLDEIIEKLSLNLHGIREKFKLLVPFPKPCILEFNMKTKTKLVLREMPFSPTPIPNPIQNLKREKVLLITHQRNEELLMPFFIIQHAPMFDRAILIDFESTDKTIELVEEYAPPSWKVVKSTTGKIFDAAETDKQVMDWEEAHPKDWHIALTTTEFLVHPNFRADLFNKQQQIKKNPEILYYQALLMVGDDSYPLQHFTSLIHQRNKFIVGPSMYTGDYHRFLHIGTSRSHSYGIGRHALVKNNIPWKGNFTHNGFIMKWLWTPWPESAARKLEVGKTVPESDVAKTWGIQHAIRSKNGMQGIEKERQDLLGNASFTVHDLCDDNDYAFSTKIRVYQRVAEGACKEREGRGT